MTQERLDVPGPPPNPPPESTPSWQTALAGLLTEATGLVQDAREYVQAEAKEAAEARARRGGRAV